MKNLVYILYMMLSLSCSNNDDKSQNNVPHALFGKWKLIEIYSSDDGSQASWSPYDSGEVYDIWFKENSEFIVSNMIEDCQIGSFSMSSNDEIIIDLPCSEQSIIPIDSLSESILITNTTYIEYELSKYQRVSE